jgi:hypothetical protein
MDRQLTTLTFISFKNQYLTGTISSTFTSVTSLTYLNLDANSLTGIPEIGTLPLRTLKLASNNLSGQFPAGFSQLTSCNLSKNPSLCVADLSTFTAVCGSISNCSYTSSTSTQYTTGTFEASSTSTQYTTSTSASDVPATSLTTTNGSPATSALITTLLGTTYSTTYEIASPTSSVCVTTTPLIASITTVTDIYAASPAVATTAAPFTLQRVSQAPIHRTP